jgi:hypothetical protein
MGFTELFAKHNTDKGWRHGYGPAYDAILAGRKPRTVLEVGVHAGFSLLAWAEAWPEAEVYGVDVVERSVIEPHPRVHVMLADATVWSVRYVLPPAVRYDLIIDDGSHRLIDQVLTCVVLSSFLEPGGLYVIEDVASARKAKTLLRLARPDFHGQRIDVVGPNMRHDDRLVVFSQGPR